MLTRSAGHMWVVRFRSLRRIGPPAKSAIPALIGALTHRHKVANAEPDYSAAEAAAAVLGSFGGEAKAAIPALVEAIRTREKDDANALAQRFCGGCVCLASAPCGARGMDQRAG